MQRHAKLQKLNAFRCSLPHVSQSALSALLSKAKNGLPELTARRDIREARDLCTITNTPYGMLIQSITCVGHCGVDVDVDIVNPLALLHVASTTKYFGKLLQDTFASHPCTLAAPWKLILYLDEAKPGSQFKQDNKRVLQNVYWSFLEFGAAALSKEDFWLEAGTIRS